MLFSDGPVSFCVFGDSSSMSYVDQPGGRLRFWTSLRFDLVVCNGEKNVREDGCWEKYWPFPLVVEFMVCPERDDPKSVAVLREAVGKCVDGGMFDLVSSLREFVLYVAECFPLFGRCEGG